MADPFSKSNSRKDAQERRDAHDKMDAARAKQVQASVAASAKKAAEKPNSDIGYPWRKKFYEPGF